MSIKEDIEKVDKKVKKVEQSLAWDMLQDAKKTNKRMFILIIIILCMWLATIGAFLYYINTTGFIETDEYSQEIKDIDSVNNSKIINGDEYGANNSNKKEN